VADTTSDREQAGGAALVRTFLLADVRGYTRYTREHGDEAASRLARRLAGLVGSPVSEFSGELLEVRGDETLCVFTSARQALRAAVEIQRRLRAPEDGDPFPLGVGMGLDAGEAVPTDGGYRGAALNMAGRLVAIAGPGEIRATERLVELTGQIEGLAWSEAKRVRLKGLDRPERVVSVEPVDPLPTPPAPPPHTSDRRSGRLVAATAVLALVVAVAGVAFSLRGGSGDPTTKNVRVHPNSVAVVDRAGRIVANVRVGLIPSAVAFGLGSVWVANTGDNTLSRIDPDSRAVTATVPLTGTPVGLATGGGYVWVFDNGTGSVFQVSPSGSVVEQYRLRGCSATGGVVPTACPYARIAYGYGRVWVGDGLSGVYTLRPSEDRFRKVAGTLPAWRLAVGNGKVYSADDVKVALISPTRVPFAQDAQTVVSNPDHVGSPIFMAAARGSVWAASPLGTVLRLDSTLSPVRSVSRHSGHNAIAFGNGAVWVTNLPTHALLELNADNLRLLGSVSFGRLAPSGVAVDAHHSWVTLDDPTQVPTYE